MSSFIHNSVFTYLCLCVLNSIRNWCYNAITTYTSVEKTKKTSKDKLDYVHFPIYSSKPFHSQIHTLLLGKKRPLLCNDLIRIKLKGI